MLATIKQIVEYRAKADRLANGESPETVIYSPEEAAHRLGISNSQLADLIKSGIVATPEVGRFGKWILTEAYCRAIDNQQGVQCDVKAEAAQAGQPREVLCEGEPPESEEVKHCVAEALQGEVATRGLDDGLAARLDTVDARLTDHDSRIDSVDARLSIALSMHDSAPSDTGDGDTDDNTPDPGEDDNDTGEAQDDTDDSFAVLSDSLATLDNDLSERIDAVDERLDAIDALNERNRQRMAEGEGQMIDDAQRIDKLADSVARLRQGMQSVLGRLDVLELQAAKPPEISAPVVAPVEPVKPEPETVLLPPVKVKPTCPKCGSPDGWKLEPLVGDWFCRRCGVIDNWKPKIDDKGGAR